MRTDEVERCVITVRKDERESVAGVDRSTVMPGVQTRLARATAGALQHARIVQGVVDAIRVELPAGVAETGDVAESAAAQVRLRRNDQDTMVQRDSLRTAAGFFARASRHLPAATPPERHRRART